MASGNTSLISFPFDLPTALRCPVEPERAAAVGRRIRGAAGIHRLGSAQTAGGTQRESAVSGRRQRQFAAALPRLLQYQLSAAPRLDSNYHALLAQLERRFHNGFNILASYTYGHSIDGGSGAGDRNDPGAQDARNLAAQRGSSNFDVKHRFVLSGVYELPFGKKPGVAGTADPRLADFGNLLAPNRTAFHRNVEQGPHVNGHDCASRPPARRLTSCRSAQREPLVRYFGLRGAIVPLLRQLRT